jgi:hypothetical protein
VSRETTVVALWSSFKNLLDAQVFGPKKSIWTTTNVWLISLSAAYFKLPPTYQQTHLICGFLINLGTVVVSSYPSWWTVASLMVAGKDDKRKNSGIDLQLQIYELQCRWQWYKWINKTSSYWQESVIWTVWKRLMHTQILFQLKGSEIGLARPAHCFRLFGVVFPSRRGWWLLEYECHYIPK